MAKKSKDTKTKTIFELLSCITDKKTKWEDLSDLDKKKFSPFLINRFLSMNMNYIELINELQPYTIGVLSSRDVYKLYYDILPKKKSYNKYIKGKSAGKYNDKLLEYLTKWFKVSTRECMDYIDLLSKDELLSIVMKFGVEKKEATKIIK